MLKRVLLCCFLTLGIAISCYSQSFKWIKQIGDKANDVNPLCKILPDGKSLIVWTYVDSTKIDGFKSKSQKSKNTFLLSLLDKYGKAKWIWKPDSCFSVINHTAIAYSESLGKIFVCGNFDINATINKATYKGNYNGFIIRFDTNGTFEKTYILSDTSAIFFESMVITSQNELLIGMQYNNFGSNFKLSIPSLGFSINKRGSFLLKLDKDLKPQKISEPLYGNKTSRFLICLKSNNQILSVGRFVDTLRIGSNYYYNGKNVSSTYLTYWDSNLVFKKNSLLFKTLSSSANINSLKSFQDGSILIAGYYIDTISIIPKKYKNKSGIALFACLDSNLNLKWAKVPDIKQGESIVSEIMDIEISGDFIYAGGIFNGNAHYDDFHLPDTSGIFWFFKTDSRGNILWMTRCANSKAGQFVASISANKQKEVLISGYIVDTVKLNKQVYITQKSRADILLMKIHDIEIYRGYVKIGPYCAGDTIKIPYTKDGDFNSGNQFIAQLSDEDGNFTGRERELGRLTTTKEGTIKGVLPLFDVESSPNYRIRILSTDPVVQSYYKSDTLRLLIYSKDTANAGPPETICMGDSIQLRTTGGSKWTWSPSNNMNDSSLKKPIVWPTATTTYKIIIADSSGCGKPDTAYKIIRVRKPLKANIAFKDTAVCDTSVFKIPAAFTGGDSVNYSWQWVSVSAFKPWKLMNSGKLKLNDTLAHIPKVTLYKNDTLALVLADNCTNKNDTAFFIIRLLKPTVLLDKLNDTLYCKGRPVILKANAWYAQTYQWLWRDMTNSNVLSTNDSLNLTANATVKIKLTLSNGCTKDSNEFMLKVNPPLEVNMKLENRNLNDTMVCYGQSLQLFTKGTGGKGTGYNYTWRLNGSVISSKDTLYFNTKNLFSNSNSNSTLTLILKDNCTIPNDSITKTIKVTPTPKADFTYGLLCSRSATDFTFTGTKPQSPIITNFLWNLNKEDTSTLLDPSFIFAIPGSKQISLTLTSSNGCTDSVKKDIIIKPQSKADFTAENVCETDSVVFINKSQFATGYNWRFGDGQSSKIQNPKHKFQIATTTTFNVSLVALVAGGCSDSLTKAVTINENPSSDFTFIQTGNTFDLKATQTGLTSYKWTFGTTDSITKTSNTLTHILTSSKQSKICLSVIDLSGCTSQTCQSVTVGLYIIKKGNEIRIYPNPNSGSFSIEIENPEKDISIEVYDLLGKLIKTVETTASKSSYSLALNVANGIYLVKVTNGGRAYNQKVSISKEL